MTNILWAYDESSGSFSALPASPWLLPAIGLLAFAALCKKIKPPSAVVVDTGRPIDYQTMACNSSRYYQLLERQSIGDLSESEQVEMINLAHPPWARPGETWTY
jgi:hypothetical protein